MQRKLLLIQCSSKGNISEGARKRRRREPLGGRVWGHADPENFEI